MHTSQAPSFVAQVNPVSKSALVACLKVLVVAEQVGKVRDGPPAASAAAIDSRDEAVGLQKIDAIKVIKPR